MPAFRNLVPLLPVELGVTVPGSNVVAPGTPFCTGSPDILDGRTFLVSVLATVECLK